MSYKEVYDLAFEIGKKLVSNVYGIDNLIFNAKSFDAKSSEDQAAKIAIIHLLTGMKNTYIQYGAVKEINSSLENETVRRILISIYFSNINSESISEYSNINLQKVKSTLERLELDGLVLMKHGYISLTAISEILISSIIEREISFIENYDELPVEEKSKIIKNLFRENFNFIEKKYFACESCGSTKQCKIDCTAANEELKKLQECTDEKLIRRTCKNCSWISCRDICPMCSDETLEKDNIENADIQAGGYGLTTCDVINRYISCIDGLATCDAIDRYINGVGGSNFCEYCED